MSLLVIILAVLLVHDIHAAYKLAGPYEIEILEVNECQDNTGNQFGFTTKLNKKSKSEKVWTTDLNLACDFDNASKLVIDAEKWGSGGWQSNAFHHEADDICNSGIKDLPGVYNVVMEHSGIPLECPVKKGSYTLNELPTKWGKQSKFPELPYGKYRAELKFLCSGEVIGCLSVTLDIMEIAD